MFTARNTLAGAVIAPIPVLLTILLPNASGLGAAQGPLAAWAVMVHVWFLVGHLRLKDRERTRAAEAAARKAGG